MTQIVQAELTREELDALIEQAQAAQHHHWGMTEQTRGETFNEHCAKAHLFEKIETSLRSAQPVQAEGGLASEILAELQRARSKFPGKNVTFAALVEEVGELATATFSESKKRVRKEAVQVAVMAMRLVLDGDHTFDQWRTEHGLDALVEEVGGE